MDRILEMDDVSRIGSLTIQVLTIPIPQNFEPEAIVGLAGMGEPWRIRLPIKAWEESQSAKFFLLAGIYWEEKYYEPLSVESLVERHGLKRIEGVRVQEKARHTRAQTDWIIDQVNELEISSFVFMTSQYHLTRAYLTLLKSYLRFADHKVVMVPKPLMIPPTAILPEVDQSARAMIPGEIQRIIKYQQPQNPNVSGNVATLEELEQYLDQIYPLLIRE